MKRFNLTNITLASIIFTIANISCTSEAPFSAEGEGKLRINVSVNSKLTRANIEGDELKKLLDDCVIYISDEYGLLHKWQGVSNIPDELSLKYGSYVAEAWSGDSVTASFDSKFYKGIQAVSINEAVPVANVTINCRLANVVGSVDFSDIQSGLIKDLSVTFSNSRGSLEMTDEKLYEKAYFMMPDDDTVLNYIITGSGKDGSSFFIEDMIEDVEQGHEYRLKFISNPEHNTNGGAFFDIIVEDYGDGGEEFFDFYGKPSFSWANTNLQVGAQIVNVENGFNSEMLRIAAYNGGFSSLTLTTESDEIKSKLGSGTFDFAQISQEGLNNLNDKIKLEMSVKEGLHIWTMTFTADFLNSLAKSQTEYVMDLKAVDMSGKSASMKVRVANTEGAIKYDDPIVVSDANFFNNDFTAVNGTSAKIPVKIVDRSKYLGLQYRKEDDSAWILKNVISTRANEIEIVELTGLETNTKYLYRLVSGEETDGKFEFESEEYSFQTEDKFIIPNAGMENWYKDGNAWIPMKDNSESFWDSGNKGAAQFLATANMTTPNNEFKSSGQSSACLKSAYVAIKFAAGNLFVGKFKDIDGIKGADLTFGQPYNGSHPKSLKLYANYRPKSVNRIGDRANIKDLVEGEPDHGQIFIAIASSPSELQTGKGVLFNPNASNILGYGEVTWKNNFGEDGVLEEVEIPINYYPNAKTTKATHIIIVCSASKYGDYFNGGEGSTLYVDDFELVY